jgi:hypothetical protein
MQRHERHASARRSRTCIPPAVVIKAGTGFHAQLKSQRDDAQGMKFPMYKISRSQ